MKRYIAIIALFIVHCSMFISAAQAQRELTITGRVTDASGEGIIGASVIVKDSKGLGTITDFDGNYSIKVQEFRTLVFS